MKTYKEIFTEAAQAVAFAPAPPIQAKPYCGTCGGPHKTADHAHEMSKKKSKNPPSPPAKFSGVYEDENSEPSGFHPGSLRANQAHKIATQAGYKPWKKEEDERTERIHYEHPEGHSLVMTSQGKKNSGSRMSTQLPVIVHKPKGAKDGSLIFHLNDMRKRLSNHGK